MTTDYDPEDPPLHPVRVDQIPCYSWILAGIETLPPGWVNVRIWSYDEILGRDLYVTDTCPGVLHFESRVTETVIRDADPEGNIYTEYGDPWDDHPIVVGTHAAEPPHRHTNFADPTWRPAYVGGGYLGTCTTDMVSQVLAEHGFANAIPRPDDYQRPESS